MMNNSMGKRKRFRVDHDTGKITVCTSEEVKERLRPWDIFVCPICRQVFNDKDRLMAHKEETNHYWKKTLGQSEEVEVHDGSVPPIDGVANKTGDNEDTAVKPGRPKNDAPVFHMSNMIRAPKKSTSNPAHNLRRSTVVLRSLTIGTRNTRLANKMIEKKTPAPQNKDWKENRFVSNWVNNIVSTPPDVSHNGQKESEQVKDSRTVSQGSRNSSDAAVQTKSQETVKKVGNDKNEVVKERIQAAPKRKRGNIPYKKSFDDTIASRIVKTRVSTKAHSKKPKPKKSKSKKAFCTICKMYLGSDRTLVEHNKSYHEKSSPNESTCKICDKLFENRFLLWEHEETHKVDRRGYQCPRCPKVLSTKTAVIGHIKSFHKKGRFQCRRCSKIFSTKYEQTEHQKDC